MFIMKRFLVREEGFDFPSETEESILFMITAKHEERLDIYDENGIHLGEAARSVAHAEGYWHRTFHCWIVKRELGENWLLFQKRHPLKDTNPTKFDITAAGHILAGESIADGIREPQEELGIDVTMDELIPLGVIQYSQQTGSIIDQELCHVHLLFCDLPYEAYRPQLDEVTGLVQIRLEEALALFRGQAVEVEASGVEWQVESGMREAVQYKLRVEDFVPHDSYYVTMLEQIRQLAVERVW